MKTKNTLSILLISLFVVLNINAQSVDVDNLPTIKIVGMAEIQVVPDIAIKKNSLFSDEPRSKLTGHSPEK